jgi:hypothetical protein
MPYIKNTGIFRCPSDNGIPVSTLVENGTSVTITDPTAGGPVWQSAGTSYCLNTVMTRVGALAGIPDVAETYMGAEVVSFHAGGIQRALEGWGSVAFRGVDTTGPVRVAYFCDGHAKLAGETLIAKQCSGPNGPSFPNGDGTFTPTP